MTMPSRIWLDATNPDGATLLHQDHKANNHHRHAAIPPVPALPVSPPVIPPRHSPALPSSTSQDSKSRQLNAKPRPKQFRRENPDRPTYNSATRPPELISNLIDSLATISFPDPIAGERSSPRVPNPDHYPESPNPALIAPGPSDLRHSHSFEGADYTALRTALNGQFNGIDDAAEPPVVRTTKPPSSWGQSPPNRLSKLGTAVNGGLGISSGMNSPTHSVRGNGSLHSIGSQDGGRNSPSKTRSRRRSSLISPSSETFDSTISPTKRSFWTPQSTVKRKAARPVAIQGPVNELRFDALEPHDHSKQTGATPPTHYEERGFEEDNFPFNSNLPVPLGSNKEGKKPAKSPRVSPALSQGPAVPNRRSSLRPQEFPELDLPLDDLVPVTYAPKSTSKNTPKSTPQAPGGNSSTSAPGKDEPKTLTSLDVLNGHDTEVTKRIKELKAKKEQRDREARESPSPDVQVSLLSNGNTAKNGIAQSGARRKPIADIRVPQIPKRTHNQQFYK
jgi:hypothetical protein